MGVEISNRFMQRHKKPDIALLFKFVLTLFLIGYQHSGGGFLLAADVQTSPILFYHESAGTPELSQLLHEFDFDTFVSRGNGEFEKMIMLKDWVYAHIPYALNFNDSDDLNAINILRRAREGYPFLCTNIAAVYMLCAVSMGWTARYVFLRKPTNEEHAGNDIWSNQYRKWVYIDPTWNIHMEMRGVPLSIYEIRREWIRNRGRHIVYVFGAGQRAKRYRMRDLPIIGGGSDIWKYLPIDRTWLSYTHDIAILGRNDFFSFKKQTGMSFWEPVYVIRGRVSRKDKIDDIFKNGKRLKPRLLFHDLNRVDITITQPGEGRKGFHQGRAEVGLDAFGRYNYTPNFMGYLVSINHADWRVKGSRFRMKLHSGTNIVRARTLNRFGVLGPVSVRRIRTNSTRKIRHEK
jgi:hypothetical protein